MYVTRIDPDSGDITIGTREEVSRRTLRAGAANWHRRPDENEFRAIVQVRYNHRGAAGAVRLLEDGGFEVRFDEPVHAITPGQAAVIYDGDLLLGGGWIDRAGEAP
jgi:tRNA-specific 2-thiouridylase